MTQAAVEVTGLSDFSRTLKAVAPQWPKELAALHKEGAKAAEPIARSKLQAYGGQRAAAARAVTGRATATSASVGVNKSVKTPFGNAAVWGSDQRTGWNVNNADSKPQFPKWVGNTWEPGVAGTGPYGINDAIAAVAPVFEQRMLQRYDQITKQAFPN